MTYLAMDVDRVGAFTGKLRAGVDLIEGAQYYLAQAELLADLPIRCAPELHDITSDFGRMADRVDWAAGRLRSLRLTFASAFDWGHVPQPVRTPVPRPAASTTLANATTPGQVLPAQWDASPSHPWHHVHQLSSHNSYEVPGGVQVLFDQGVRSFELDIHHRAPADLIAPLVPGLVGPWVRAGDVDDPAMPRWHVYHVTGASFHEYDVLREGLAAVVALDTSDPLTVFIDVKDGFGGAHTVDAFDQVLTDELGTRLYTPAVFQTRAGDSATLLDVAQHAGWPDVDELQGRIIVVVTDEIDGYARPDALAFVAPPPKFQETAPLVVEHVPQPEAVFYNANVNRIGPAEIAAVHATATMLRTYFNPRCAINFFGEAASSAHYRAVDVGANDPVCGPLVLVSPVDVPGPSDQ